jgi:hypothetical protein
MRRERRTQPAGLGLVLVSLVAACVTEGGSQGPRDESVAALASDRPATRSTTAMITAVVIARSETLAPSIVVGDADGVLRAHGDDDLQLIRARHVHTARIVDLATRGSDLVSLDELGGLCGWSSDLGRLAWQTRVAKDATSVALTDRWIFVAGPTGVERWRRDRAGAPVEPPVEATNEPALAVALADEHFAVVEQIGNRLEIGLYEIATLSPVDRIAAADLLADVGFDNHGRLVTWHAEHPSLQRWFIVDGRVQRPSTPISGDLIAAIAFDEAGEVRAIARVDEQLATAEAPPQLAASRSLLAWVTDARTLHLGRTMLPGYVDVRASGWAHSPRARDLILEGRRSGRRLVWSVAAAELRTVAGIAIEAASTPSFGWVWGENLVTSSDARWSYAHASRLGIDEPTIIAIDMVTGDRSTSWPVPAMDNPLTQSPGAWLSLVSIAGREHLLVQPLVETAGAVAHAYAFDPALGPESRVDLPAAGVPISSPSGQWLGLAGTDEATVIDLREASLPANLLRCGTAPPTATTLEAVLQPTNVVLDDQGRLACFVETEDGWSLVSADPGQPAQKIQLPGLWAMTSDGLMIASAGRIELLDLAGDRTTIATFDHPPRLLAPTGYAGVVAIIDERGPYLLRTDGAHVRFWFGESERELQRWDSWQAIRRAAVGYAPDGAICWLYGTPGELWIPPGFEPALATTLDGLHAFLAGRLCQRHSASSNAPG